MLLVPGGLHIKPEQGQRGRCKKRYKHTNVVSTVDLNPNGVKALITDDEMNKQTQGTDQVKL